MTATSWVPPSPDALVGWSSAPRPAPGRDAEAERRAAALGPWVVAALGVSGLLRLAHSLALFAVADRDRALAADPGGADLGGVAALIQLQRVLTFGTVLAIIPTGILFLVWLHRTATALRAAGKITTSPGTLVGGWFIPVGNLFLAPTAVIAAGRARKIDDALPSVDPCSIGWIVAMAISIFSATATSGGSNASALLAEADRFQGLSFSELAATAGAACLAAVVARASAAFRRRTAAG